MIKRITKEIIVLCLVLLVVLALAKAINKYVIINVKPDSGSMEETIQIGEKVTTLRLRYIFSDLKRGDIVFFKHFIDLDKEEVYYIKRVLGLPGEIIEGRNGLIYINGDPIEEDYVTEELSSDFGPYEVPEDSYFMMGDNRKYSFDSRDWEEKFVARENIYSKALFKYPNFKWLY